MYTVRLVVGVKPETRAEGFEGVLSSRDSEGIPHDMAAEPASPSPEDLLAKGRALLKENQLEDACEAIGAALEKRSACLFIVPAL